MVFYETCGRMCTKMEKKEISWYYFHSVNVRANSPCNILITGLAMQGMGNEVTIPKMSITQREETEHQML
jgi:hypothetical protein